MSYLFEHTVLGFCWWDLLALIIVLVVAVAFAVKHHDMKKEEKDLEDKLSDIYASESVEQEQEA